jgi:hypothetical protein
MAFHNYYVSSFAAIDTMCDTLWCPTLEHVESCDGNVALGDFVRFSQVVVCSHGAPEHVKGQRTW